jgi:hypothetical protein
MKRIILPVGMAWVLLTVGPIAEGQTPSPSQPPGATRSASLTLEQRHVVKEIVKDFKVAEAPAPAPVEVGARVPESVMLSPIPVEVSNKVPQIRTHSFFVKDGRIAIVGQDKTITDVIE